MRDFSPVIEAARAPQVMVVNPRSPVRDVAGFAAWAREAEGRLSVASQGNGSIGHLAGALFAQDAGITYTHVPYRGGGPAVVDLVAGHIEALFVTLPAAIEHIRARAAPRPWRDLGAAQRRPGRRADGWPRRCCQASTW